jgi:hypothetical protein
VSATSQLNTTNSFTGTQAFALRIQQNGSTKNEYGIRPYTNQNYPTISVSGIIQCNSGDTISIQAFQNSGGTISIGGSTTLNSISINRLSGPAVIAATESVNCYYSGTTGQTIGTSAAAIIYNTKGYDSHTAFNTSTGKYTVPVSGKYRVTGAIQISATTATVGSNVYLSLGQNATAEQTDISQFSYQTTSSVPGRINGSIEVNCLAGDTIYLSVLRDSGVTSTTLGTGSAGSFIAISRIGN